MASSQSKRVALVIGNGRYVNADALRNPSNDAREIAASLSRIGFAGIGPSGADFEIDPNTPGVAANLDLDYNALRRALAAFGRLAEDAGQAVLYYAGHGIELNGQNYLIPVDAKLGHAKDVDFETASLSQVMAIMEGGSGLRLVILDACRDNPFRGRLFAGRDVSRGLRAIEPAGNVLVAYAAKHGTVAMDDVKIGGANSDNSPFAAALLNHIETPGLEIVDLFREVKDDVYDATGKRQEPHLYGSLGRRREYFVPPAPADAAKPAQPDKPQSGSGFSDTALVERAAIEHWEAIKATTSTARLREFLAAYGQSRMAPLARDRLAALEAPPAPPQPPAEPALGAEKSRGDDQVKTQAQQAQGFVGDASAALSAKGKPRPWLQPTLWTLAVLFAGSVILAVVRLAGSGADWHPTPGEAPKKAAQESGGTVQKTEASNQAGPATSVPNSLPNNGLNAGPGAQGASDAVIAMQTYIDEDGLNNPKFVRTYGEEATDFGIAATPLPRPDTSVATATPQTIYPFAKLITTGELIAAMSQHKKFVLFDVLSGAHATLPGAFPIYGAGLSTYSEQTFRQQMQAATGGDRNYALVFYCQGPRCWESYNAALKSVELGYVNTYWYRGGVQAWTLAPASARNAFKQ